VFGLNLPHAKKAAGQVLEGAEPLERNGFRLPMAHALIGRTLLKLNG